MGRTCGSRATRNSRTGLGCSKNGQAHCYRGAFVRLTLDRDGAAVDLDAALDDDESESVPGRSPTLLPLVKLVKSLAWSGAGMPMPRSSKRRMSRPRSAGPTGSRGSVGGILHRVREEVGDEVAEDGLVADGVVERPLERKRDRAAVGGGGAEFVAEFAEEGGEIKGGRGEDRRPSSARPRRRTSSMSAARFLVLRETMAR